jgi:RND family efflux transporter MFP subunit
MDSPLVSLSTDQPDGPTVPAPASEAPAPQKSPSSGRLFISVIVLAVFAFAVWQLEIKPRTAAAAELRRDAGNPDVRTVIAQHPTAQPLETDLLLPATVQAARQTTLYAQTSGYLKDWLVDIGDSVKEGQLLAEIDTPQVDQQLAQAKAALGQAKANLELAQVTANRWKELIKTHSVSSQETDEKLSAEKAREADYTAAEANVAQLSDLQRFKHIVAPFDGVITARLVEIGALISVGSSPTELFHIAQTDRMRVMVNVPQAYMRSVTPGLGADLVAREYQNRRFPGTVTRTAKAIDPQSRTLLVEVMTPNQDGALLPGMYAQIHFKLKNQEPAVMIPASALVVRASGPMVAVVDANSRYAYRKVLLGRDLGAQMEITSGLSMDDRVVTTPTDDLTEGTALDVQEPNKTEAKSK